jgi:hypothetical protein
MNIMDHEQAVKMHAAERYLLDELSQEERDDFEEHYFVCVNCADEVRAAFSFADNTRAVFSEEAAAVPPPVMAKSRARVDWFAWMRPAWAPIAAALLLSITLYQSFLVIPALRQDLSDATGAQVLPTVVARSATRGDDSAIVIGERDRFVHLILDINTAASVSSYMCEVRDESGNLRFNVAAAAPQAGSLNLLLPASGLQSGRYTITLRPVGADLQPASEAEQYTFLLQRT